MYYNLLQNWQKPFTVEMYRKTKLVLTSFKITARQVSSANHKFPRLCQRPTCRSIHYRPSEVEVNGQFPIIFDII